jgi:homoserine/homoserine lactone efflux protein
MSLQTFLLYLAAWTLAALIPGPAVMCSVAQSTRYGFRPSLAGILGIQCGNLLFFIGIASGLGELLATATTAFSVLRIAGAIYLLYLGLRILRATFRGRSSSPAQPGTVLPPQRSLFLQGLLIQITNPKALLFVSALLPQFLEPERPVLSQLAIFGLTTIAVDLVVLSSYAYLARQGIQSFRDSQGAAWLERVFGGALIFFGCRLLITRK